MLRKLKIVSDGFVSGTKVVDSVSGETIDGVTRIEFTIDAQGIYSEAKITIRNPEIEAEVSPYGLTVRRQKYD